MTDEPTKDLAQRAFDIYDQDGEVDMLSFIIENEKRDQSAQDIEPGLFTLADDTAIQHLGLQKPLYEARWSANNASTRPATMQIDRLPPYIDMKMPVLPTPNAGHILKEILDQAESLSRQEVGLIHDGKLLTLYDALTSMPGLETALKLALDLQSRKPMTAQMKDHLNEIVTNCVQDTIDFMPEGQFHTLVGRANLKLEAEGHPDVPKQDPAE